MYVCGNATPCSALETPLKAMPRIASPARHGLTLCGLQCRCPRTAGVMDPQWVLVALNGHQAVHRLRLLERCIQLIANTCQLLAPRL